MNKKTTSMRKTAVLSTAAALLIAAASCTVKSEPQYATYMTAVSEEPCDGAVSYLVTDDSVKVYPANFFQTISTLRNNQRVFASFTIPSGKITDPVEVEFSSIGVLEKDTIFTTQDMATMKNDRMTVTSAWHSGGIYGAGRFLTMTFKYMGSGYSGHTMHLVDDISADNPDQQGYWHLHVRHDTNNDPELNTYSGILTYPLDDKYTAPGIKGLIIEFSPLTPSADSTVVVNY